MEDVAADGGGLEVFDEGLEVLVADGADGLRARRPAILLLLRHRGLRCRDAGGDGVPSREDARRREGLGAGKC